VGENDPKWLNDGRCIFKEEIDDYDKMFPNDFNDYYVKTISGVNFSRYPKQYTVGLRFCFESEKPRKEFSEYLKTLGPLKNQ
jgi:hypothetical protein